MSTTEEPIEEILERLSTAEAKVVEAIRRGEDQWAGWVKEQVARKAAEAQVATLTAERNEAAATERSRIVARIRNVASRYATGSSNQRCLLVQAQSIEDGNP